MSRKYPRIVYNGRGSEKRTTCRKCGCKTHSVLCVEYSYFRGDDEVYKVCKGCQKELKLRHGTTDIDDMLDEIIK